MSIVETVVVVREGRPNGVTINKSDLTESDVIFCEQKSAKKASKKKAKK